MTKTQTVQGLLNQFNLDLGLHSEVLNLTIEGDYEHYKIIQRTLSFINNKGQIDYGNFV